MPTIRVIALPLLLLPPLATSWGCQMIDNLRGETPGKYARFMESENPDLRRLGIAKLVEKDFAQKEPYTTRYRQIVQGDEDPLVRAMALRSLTVSRDAGATDLYVRALSDADALVRIEGAKALARMPSPDAIDPLLKVLNAPDEDQDARIAAARALRFYPRRDVARALVAVLAERPFGVAWQARRSLQRITGTDYGYDDASWLEYISNPTQPLG
jgi:HEAT repeat protein